MRRFSGPRTPIRPLLIRKVPSSPERPAARPPLVATRAARRAATSLADKAETCQDLPVPHEELLYGGSTTRVVRVGDTVRRTAGAWTPAVHRLLRHLAATGFDGAPRVLGIDGSGREVLEFVEGEVGTLSPKRPLAPWFRTPAACRAIGAWIRSFQEAQRGYVADPQEPWRRAPGALLAAGEVVVHHDVSPYNTVRRPDGSLVVLDWDFARPGDPLEEVAWAAWMWAPLMGGQGWHAEYGVDPGDDVEERQRRNLVALLGGYRPTPSQRAALPEAIHDQMLRHADDLEDLATDDPAFAALVDQDVARASREDAAWWAGQWERPAWRAALEPGPDTGSPAHA